MDDLQRGDRQTDCAIRATDVSRSFHRKDGSAVVALDGFEVEVGRGEFLCLVGPSGCGKSTFLRLLAGLISPSGGEIQLSREHPDRPLCATVFQEYSVYPWRTVEENVRFGLDIAGVDRPEANERVRHWINRVGLRGFEKAYPDTLSGGMKQRVALARALVIEPEILLMDEPFAALDAQLRLVLQDALLDIWQEMNTTVVFITHSLDEAILLGDRVVLMTARPGRLKTEFSVPFPRPRDSELRGTAEFAAMETAIWHALREEVDSSMTAPSTARTGA